MYIQMYMYMYRCIDICIYICIYPDILVYLYMCNEGRYMRTFVHNIIYVYTVKYSQSTKENTCSQASNHQSNRSCDYSWLITGGPRNSSNWLQHVVTTICCNLFQFACVHT